jgi:hypothetical protein
MGRAGIEPATLGLRVGAEGFGLPRLGWLFVEGWAFAGHLTLGRFGLSRPLLVYEVVYARRARGQVNGSERQTGLLVRLGVV